MMNVSRIVAVFLLVSTKSWASDYTIWNTTQIEKDGQSYQIEGLKPLQGAGGGNDWLADVAELKGNDFTLVGCREVLLNRHLCKDIHFADGSSVKRAVLERGYGFSSPPHHPHPFDPCCSSSPPRSR